MNLSKLLLLIFLVSSQTYLAQSQALNFINYPISTASFGMGNQSVALTSGKDALTFNPANLVYNKGLHLSFFRQPFQITGGHYPVSNYSGIFEYPDLGVFSFEYRNQDYGTWTITSPTDPTPLGYYDNIDRSFALGFGRIINDKLALGAALKYSKVEIGQGSADLFSLSLGINYNFELFCKQFNLGVSLMNLGPAVTFELDNTFYQNKSMEDSPPSNINIGLYSEPVSNNFYSLGIQLAFSKPFDRSSGEDAKSSFKTLFSDWDDFPNDAILNTGLGYIWKPLSFGNEIYFWQEFYVGNRSRGIKSGLQNFYTQSALMGIEYAGIRFTAGYAGYWHNVHYPNYLEWTFPYETVQFTLGLSEKYFWGESQTQNYDTKLDRIVISAGTGYSNKVGKFAEPEVFLSFDNGLSYYLDAAFYIAENTALVSSFIYHPYDVNLKINNKSYPFTKYETITVLSSLRHHPVDEFKAPFVQAGFGIYRWNPVIKSTPRYEYNAVFTAGIGAEVDIYGGLVIIPSIDWLLTFERATGSSPRMQGWNQFDFSLKVGYCFR
ncbi:MAG: hypothetical protein HND52_16945 [Ignavibacteriae bacterium]|nr:hypothetical protein [Ignavibacteriota bacterium]NOG99648.1 hypothetical protein [Ignavibacteriota bacterium]